MSKLTKSQVSVLRKVATPSHTNTVWILGRVTCEALRKRGLIHSSSGDSFPIRRYDGNPSITISEKGLEALRQLEQAPPPIKRKNAE